jgi:hypothetical protein
MTVVKMKVTITMLLTFIGVCVVGLLVAILVFVAKGSDNEPLQAAAAPPTSTPLPVATATPQSDFGESLRGLLYTSCIDTINREGGFGFGFTEAQKSAVCTCMRDSVVERLGMKRLVEIAISSLAADDPTTPEDLETAVESSLLRCLPEAYR